MCARVCFVVGHGPKRGSRGMGVSGRSDGSSDGTIAVLYQDAITCTRFAGSKGEEMCPGRIVCRKKTRKLCQGTASARKRRLSQRS